MARARKVGCTVYTSIITGGGDHKTTANLDKTVASTRMSRRQAVYRDTNKKATEKFLTSMAASVRMRAFELAETFELST